MTSRESLQHYSNHTNTPQLPFLVSQDKSLTYFPAPVNSTQKDGELREAHHIFHSAMEKVEGDYVIKDGMIMHTLGYRKVEILILVFHTF